VNDLDKLCKAKSAGLTLHQLMSRCNSYGMAWNLDGLKIGMIIAGALLLALFVLLDRLNEKKDDPANPGTPTGIGAPTIIFNLLEALVYGGLAVWAGSSAGLILALMLDPQYMGVLLIGFAVVALLMMIAALVKGTGGNKGLGAFCFLLLIGAHVGAAIFAFQVPNSGRAGDPYGTYLTVISIFFALSGFVGAWIVTIYRGYHWSVAWLLIPLNASWGLLGNILGLMNHFASGFFYDKSGGEVDKRVFYVLYADGFHLKADYDFTLGDAVSANKVEKHEAVHVIQHFLFGPIYPLSYAAWAVLMFLPGIIAGAAADNRTVGTGITDLCYYNCPWEQIAYVEEGSDNDGEDKLIFNKVVGWIINVIWVLGATGLAILYIHSRS